MSMYPKRVRQALKNKWTNQTGLKQAGSANKIGITNNGKNQIRKRVNTNVRTCGGYLGYRCYYELDASKVSDETLNKYCTNVKNIPGVICKPMQPVTRQNAGGVGNIYTSRKNNCASSCVAETCYSLKENFSSGSLVMSELLLPNDSDHHHIDIHKSEQPWAINSGTWTNNNLKNPPGFNSLQAPLSTQFYARFAGTGDTNDKGDIQGRYLKSKNFDFKNLVSITVAYIAGGISMEKISDVQKNEILSSLANNESFAQIKTKPVFSTDVNLNGDNFYKILNGGDIPDVHFVENAYPRDGEDLFIQFYNENNDPVGKEYILWKPKDKPVIAGQGDLYIYGSNKFSVKTFFINDDEIKSKAMNFKIQQRRHTDVLDNYGVKYIQCNFCSSHLLPLPNTPSDNIQQTLVRKNV